MHVAGLQLFTPPPDAGPDYMRNTYEAMRACDDVGPTFRKHPASALGGITNLAWSYTTTWTSTTTYGKWRRPAPGRIRSRWTDLPAGRQPASAPAAVGTHLIEGLTDGRFAVYTKMHDAIVDGVSGLKLMQGALSLISTTPTSGCHGHRRLGAVAKSIVGLGCKAHRHR